METGLGGSSLDLPIGTHSSKQAPALHISIISPNSITIRKQFIGLGGQTQKVGKRKKSKTKVYIIFPWNQV